MDHPEKENTAKDVFSPVFTQRGGDVNDKDKTFGVVSSKGRHISVTTNASEDGACSSYESLERVSLASKKRKKTTRHREKKFSCGTINPQKFDELADYVSISADKIDPSPSICDDFEAEWLLSKLEELQGRLDEELQKLIDQADGGFSSSTYLHCTSGDPPAVPQPDLYTTNNQSSLEDPSNCSTDSDKHHLESLPALSSGTSLSPVPSSASTPQVSSKHSSLTKREQNTENVTTGLNVQLSPKFRRLDRLWNASEQKFIIMEPAAERGPHDAVQTEDYIFVIRRDLDCDKTHIKTTVEIKNSLLKECLQNIIGNISGVNLAEENPTLDPKSLFL